jgi:hypothetical protein
MDSNTNTNLFFIFWPFIVLPFHFLNLFFLNLFFYLKVFNLISSLNDLKAIVRGVSFTDTTQKTARTAPNHNRSYTKPQPILIGASAGACNRKTTLQRKPHRTSLITLLVCYTCMLMLYAGDVTLYLYANGM